MKRVALIYNPASGQVSRRRSAAVESAMAELRRAGVEAEALETDAPGSARTLARAATKQGCDAVIACGGDGTVNEVLQALVGTEIALGVIPLGTANALAQNLGLGVPPAQAMRKLLGAKTVEVPVGRVFYRDAQGTERSRYFTVAAGVGADALLMKSMDAELKRKLGYALYMFEAFRIWATHPFPLFEMRATRVGSRTVETAEISQLLAVRVRSFGGALRQFVPGASVRSPFLSLIAFQTRSRYRYLRFLLATIAGRQTFARGVDLLEAERVELRPRNGSKKTIWVEADGEVLGGLPARMEMASETLRLLVPEGAEP
jgi:diacylglycerol kinase (ATP)